MIWVILLIVHIALLSFVVNHYFSRFLDEIRHPEKYEFSTKEKTCYDNAEEEECRKIDTKQHHKNIFSYVYHHPSQMKN